MISTANSPDVVEYSDIGALLVVLPDQRLAYPQGADARPESVIEDAMRAAVERAS